MREYKRDKRNDRHDSRRSNRGSDRYSGGRSPDRKSSGFNRGRSPDRRSSGFNKRGRRDEKTMHTVMCDGCGKECEVPFRPTEGKPVYCSDCFKSKGKGNTAKQHNYKEDLDKMNEKLDLILEIVKGIKTMKESKIEKPKKAEKKTTKKKAVKKKK